VFHVVHLAAAGLVIGACIAPVAAVYLRVRQEQGLSRTRADAVQFGAAPSDYLRISRGYRRPRDGYFLRAESFFNVATALERLDAEAGGGRPLTDAYGGRPLHDQSHGESFMALLNHRFGGQGLYVLDEPEAALSPQRQLAALARIHQLVKAGSQFIIATHSPILMAYPDARIYACLPDGLRRTDYEDTEHYQVTLDFLRDPRRTLDTLLADEP